MGWPAAIAAIGGSLISSGASIYGAKTQAAASDRAANIQRKSAKELTRLQLAFLREVRADIADAVEKGLLDLDEAYDAVIGSLDGYEPVKAYVDLLRDPGAIMDRPSVKYFYDRGMEALNARASTASGGGLSGPSLMALQEYGQNYAASALDAELARLDPLMRVQLGAEGLKEKRADLRLAGATGGANVTAAVLPGIVGTGLSAADAAAYKDVNKANIYANLATQLAGTGTDLMNYFATRPELFSAPKTRQPPLYGVSG